MYQYLLYDSMLQKVLYFFTDADCIVGTSPLALRWLCDSPRTGCARRTTIYIYVARTSNDRVIAACELYCCLLPQCAALRTCRSGFPIATVSYVKHCLKTYVRSKMRRYRVAGFALFSCNENACATSHFVAVTVFKIPADQASLVSAAQDRSKNIANMAAMPVFAKSWQLLLRWWHNVENKLCAGSKMSYG